MKSHPVITLSLTLAALVLVSPKSVAAEDQTPAQNQYQAPRQAEAQTQYRNTMQPAQDFVPAQANLEGTLDAKKTQPGHDVKAVLTQSVRLKNGTELPHGTTLIGTVETDNMQPAGQSALTLRFTQAQLKDGKQVPITATIVGVAPPVNTDNADQANAPAAVPWDGRATQFDVQGVLSGVDLHSRIASQNSGTFISSKKDVKLTNGSQLALALGPQGNA